jgi:hypothetical protein
LLLLLLQLGASGSCPYRAAEKHVHSDPFSNYGAAVTITSNGNLLLIGAPSAWDNMQKQGTERCIHWTLAQWLMMAQCQ